MLTVEENELLTRVGPGTPMGDLLRRYWHPIAGESELEGRATKQVRLLGEDLVLFKDRSGDLGLIEPLCPHRRINLLYGVPLEHGLRCPYHGWAFDQSGACIEQPYEDEVDPESTFRDKIHTTAYPVKAAVKLGTIDATFDDGSNGDRIGLGRALWVGPALLLATLALVCMFHLVPGHRPAKGVK